jgi:hypothetical protein
MSQRVPLGQLRQINMFKLTISHANLDFVCITETWLKYHIDSHVVGIAGYTIVRLDRKVISHGGVSMYIRDSVRYNVLLDLIDENFEDLWVKIRPDRLPRGIPSIVIGTVYHPPRADNSLIQNYMYESLSKIERRFLDCGVTLQLLGEFN